MEELIKVNHQGDKQTTSARDLWEFLGKPYTEFLKWFNQYKEYGFIENEDYRAIRVKFRTAQGNESEAMDYEITVDMAKQLSPELQMFNTIFQSVLNENSSLNEWTRTSRSSWRSKTQ